MEYKMLIVDDNFINRKILNKLLTDLGVTVVEASSGKEAVELVENNDFMVVFVDLYLPGLSAGETSQAIKEKSNAKVIVVTSNPEQVTTQMIQEYAFTDVLKKPYQINDLEQLIMKHVIEASSTPVEDPVFDIKEFVKIYDNKAMQQEIIEALLEEKENDIKRMKDAYKTKDTKVIYKALHYMKGSYSYLKATRVLNITQNVLNLAKEDKVKEVLASEDTVIENYELLVKELELFKDKL